MISYKLVLSVIFCRDAGGGWEGPLGGCVFFPVKLVLDLRGCVCGWVVVEHATMVTRTYAGTGPSGDSKRRGPRNPLAAASETR